MAQRIAGNLSHDDVFADWLRWIERIRHEAIAQAWRTQMFRLLKCVFEQNNQLQATGGFFVHWAADDYVAATSMALRRELDGRKGSENLHHMLHEMLEQPTVLSRARFQSAWSGKSEYWTADLAFEQWPLIRDPADPAQDYVDPAMMAADLATLAALDDVLNHIQTTVAHRAPTRPNAMVPTFRDLHDAAEHVGELFKKYYLLLAQNTMPTLEPSPQYNIYEPFPFAWIADAEAFDYSRCETPGS